MTDRSSIIYNQSSINQSTIIYKSKLKLRYVEGYRNKKKGPTLLLYNEYQVRNIQPLKGKPVYIMHMVVALKSTETVLCICRDPEFKSLKMFLKMT